MTSRLWLPDLIAVYCIRTVANMRFHSILLKDENKGKRNYNKHIKRRKQNAEDEFKSGLDPFFLSTRELEKKMDRKTD